MSMTLPAASNSIVEWLFLDLNSFFASCEQQENPSLRGKPVGVVPLMADTTSCIAASVEAKRFGVKTGTLVKEAKRLCPGIRFVLARHDVYLRYHHQVVEAVESQLPVQAVLSIDEMACRLTGSQRSLKNAVALAQAVKAALRARVGERLTASIGLAPNRFLAKVGSDMQKPDGLTVLLKEELPSRLFGLQLRDLPGIGPRMEERLRKNGVGSIEALSRCSVQELRRIWGGIGGERFWKWIRGEEVDLPPTRTRSIGHEHVLEPRLRTREGAYAVAQKLLIKAAVRLRKNAFFARRMGVAVKFMRSGAREDGNSHWERAAYVEETQDTLRFLRELERLWSELPPDHRPLRVSVVLFDLIPKDQHQLSLFEDPRRQSLIEMMDRLNARYGKNTVHFAGIHEFLESAPTRIAFSRIPDASEF